MRKAAELRAKVAALSSELKFWRDVSEAGGDWEKHYSQIRRIGTPLDVATARLQTDIEAAATEGAILAKARRLERLIIDLHSVWEFFRVKLLLRATDPFKTSLLMADEFAWACYRPALDKIDELRKEPPLTFFKTETSPYAIPRGRSYVGEIDNAHMQNSDSTAMLKALPVPVIGIPWFQSRHLPDLLIVAHETGHHVEELGLKEDLEAAVRDLNLPPGHKDAWLSWRGEVFADVYGTLTAGPAFPTALFDFLAVAKASIAAESRSASVWGDYPTSYLRMLVCLSVLRLRFKADADAIEQSWRMTFPNHAMQAWEGDCETIGKAIVERRYCNDAFALTDLGAFSKINQEHAFLASEAARRQEQVNAIDVRELVSAAAFAFSADPEAFDKPKNGSSPQERIAAQIAKSRTAGARSGARDRGPQIVIDAKPRDAATGDQIYDQLVRGLGV